MGGDRVLVVARIPDERPARPVAATQEPRHRRPALQPAVRHGRRHPRRQRGEGLTQDGRERFRDALPAQLAHPLRGGAHEDAGEPVVGGDQARGDASAVGPLVADGRQLGVVAVEDRAGGARPPHHRCTDPSRDGRADAVRAHRDGRPDRLCPPLFVPGTDADHAVPLAQQRRDGRLVPNLRARGGGRVDQDAVQEQPPRRIERLDSRGGAQRDLDRLAVGIVERRAPDRRSSRGDQAREQAPPGQLQHAGSHQAVGREGVAAVGAAVDQGHPGAGPGQQQGRRCPGDATTDDDDVEVAHRAQPVVTSMLTGTPWVNTSYTAERSRDRSTTSRSLSASSPSRWKLTRISW